MPATSGDGPATSSSRGLQGRMARRREAAAGVGTKESANATRRRPEQTKGRAERQRRRRMRVTTERPSPLALRRRPPPFRLSLAFSSVLSRALTSPTPSHTSSASHPFISCSPPASERPFSRAYQPHAAATSPTTPDSCTPQGHPRRRRSIHDQFNTLAYTISPYCPRVYYRKFQMCFLRVVHADR